MPENVANEIGCQKGFRMIEFVSDIFCISFCSAFVCSHAFEFSFRVFLLSSMCACSEEVDRIAMRIGKGMSVFTVRQIYGSFLFESFFRVCGMLLWMMCCPINGFCSVREVVCFHCVIISVTNMSYTAVFCFCFASEMVPFWGSGFFEPFGHWFGCFVP